MSLETKPRESIDSELVNVGDVVPAATEREEIQRIAAKLKKRPELWGWTITSVVYGHGKVVVQCRTPKGNGAQFVGRVGID